MTDNQKSKLMPHNYKENPLSSRSFILILCLFLMLLLAAKQPLPPNDFFPYVRIGEEIVNTGSIPTTEFMTYTQFGKPVQYQYWLSSLIFYWVFKTGGVTLTTLLVLFCTAVFIILLWLCLMELDIDPILSGLLVFILGLTAGSNYIARPQIFALPLYGFTLLSLLKWQRKKDQLLWLLPLTTVIWVNFHGSFIIQFFLLLPAVVFGSGNRKRLLLVIAVCLLATLLNIYGLGIWKSIFSVVGNPSNQIYSVEFQKPTNEGWQANILFGTFLLIPVLTALLKPKVKFLYWVWFVGFGWMAMSGIRYGVWYLGLSIILLGLMFHTFFEQRVNSNKYFQNRKMNLVVSMTFPIIILACLPGIREYWWKTGPPAYSDMTPVSAVEWLKQNPHLPGELWSNFDSSTYLTYALPERKLFMTNRMDDFPVEQYEDYLTIFHGRYNWQTVLDKYQVKLVLFDQKESPVLSQAINASSDWKQVYHDDRFRIFARSTIIQSKGSGN